MKCSHCPASCTECTATPRFTEVEYTIKARGNPDQEMTIRRKGFLCEKESFFFCQKDVLLEEEEIINRFANSVS